MLTSTLASAGLLCLVNSSEFITLYACRILVWEDGFCNFAASAAPEVNSGDCSTPPVYGNCEFQPYQGLQPELFFKMSHEIYNYGEGYMQY